VQMTFAKLSCINQEMPSSRLLREAWVRFTSASPHRFGDAVFIQADAPRKQQSTLYPRKKSRMLRSLSRGLGG